MIYYKFGSLSASYSTFSTSCSGSFTSLVDHVQVSVDLLQTTVDFLRVDYWISLISYRKSNLKAWSCTNSANSNSSSSELLKVSSNSC